MEYLGSLGEHASELIKMLSGYISEYGLRLLGAIVVLVIGLWIVKMIVRNSQRLMEKSKIDASLRSFLKSLIDIVLKVLLIISVMSMMGIKMTSFIALLGAAGLAVGMALSGTLQNFAGGVIILIFKPFKVGDFSINFEGSYHQWIFWLQINFAHTANFSEKSFGCYPCRYCL